MIKEAKNAADGQGWVNALFRSRETSLVLLIAVLTLITTVLNPRFLSPQSLKDLMLNVSIIALLVLGQTVIILMRQIDLSISSTVGITAFLSGTLFINQPGISGFEVIAIAVLVGLLLGAVNAVNVPGSFLAIGTSTIAGIPVLTWIVVILLILFSIGLRQYRAGREYYA